MALPASGELSFSSINEQLRRPGAQGLSLNDGQVRGLAVRPSGAIAVSNLHGKWAGTRILCKYIDLDGYVQSGFSTGMLPGSTVEGQYAGSNVNDINVFNLGSWVLGITTAPGQPVPTSNIVKVTDDSFNLIGTWTMQNWVADGAGGYYNNCLNLPFNPFPHNSIRWITW